MGQQQVLDLFRVHVLAAATEHVVDAAAEVEEPVLVLAEDVAGVQPAIRELRAGDLRLVGKAQADIRAPDQQLAFLGIAAVRIDQPELDVGRRDAGAAARDWTAVDRRAQRAAAFGQPGKSSATLTCGSARSTASRSSGVTTADPMVMPRKALRSSVRNQSLCWRTS